jgi:hypothetical protein
MSEQVKIIDAKMEEISDLISGFSDKNNIMYRWQSNDNSELIINFDMNGKLFRYEFNILNLTIDKYIDNEKADSIDLKSIDEGLDYIDVDIHKILGVKENKMNYLKYFKDF